MQRSLREPSVTALAVLLAAAPFVAGLIRAAKASDLRLLWMALAAFLGSVLVRWVATGRGRAHDGAAALCLLTFVVAAALAGLTAYLLGARWAVGVWMVAVVLGLFLAGSVAVRALSRPRTT
jgi:hypothetical protein